MKSLTTVRMIDSSSTEFPEVLGDGIGNAVCWRMWAIGSVDLLHQRLLGFFCSNRCPGEVILRVYDLARELRDAGAAVIGGFHSVMEKECLDLLLRGKQPIVICPARSIGQMRIPAAWRKRIDKQRLLVLSPFEQKHRRPTTALAEQRNHFVASLARDVFVAHAAPNSKMEQLCHELARAGTQLFTVDCAENAGLMALGARSLHASGILNQRNTHLSKEDMSPRNTVEGNGVQRRLQ